MDNLTPYPNPLNADEILDHRAGKKSDGPDALQIKGVTGIIL